MMKASYNDFLERTPGETEELSRPVRQVGVNNSKSQNSGIKVVPRLFLIVLF